MSASRVAQAVVAVAVVGVTFLYFLPRLVDFTEVWAAIRAMTLAKAFDARRFGGVEPGDLLAGRGGGQAWARP